MNQAFFIVKDSLANFFQEAKESKVTTVWVGNRLTVKEPFAALKIEVSAVRIVDGFPLIMVYTLLYWEGLYQGDEKPDLADVNKRLNTIAEEALNLGFSVHGGLLSLHPINSETK